MSEDNATVAVSGAGESAPSEGASTPSGTTQTGAESPTTESTPESSTPTTETPAKPDWRKLLREDEEAKKILEEESNRLAQKWRDRDKRQEKRSRANKAVETSDAELALEIAGEVANEQDDDDVRQSDFLKKQQIATPILSRLARSPEYAEVYQREGKAAMDKRYAEDPDGFADWMLDQITDVRAAAKNKKTAPVLAEAMAEAQIAEALRNLPSPTIGAGGGLGIGSYTQLTDEQRRDLKRTPEGRAKLDALTSRLTG